MIIRLEGPPEKFVQIDDIRLAIDEPTNNSIVLYWRCGRDQDGDPPGTRFKDKDRDTLLRILRKYAFKE